MTLVDRKQTGKIIMKFCSGLVFSVEKFSNGPKESRWERLKQGIMSSILTYH